MVTALPLAGRAESARWLWRTVWRYRWSTIAAVGLITLGQVAILTLPSVVGRIVDEFRAGAPGSAVGMLIGVMVGLSIVAGVLVTSGRSVLGKLLGVVCTDIRDDALHSALTMPLQLLEAIGIGDVIARISEDTRAVGITVRYALPTILEGALAAVVATGVFIALDYRLALAVVAAIPAHVWASHWYLRRSEPGYEALGAASATHAERTLSIASELVMIRRFGLSSRYAALDESHSDHVARVHFSTVVLRTRYFGRISMAEPVAFLVALGVGAALLYTGAITAGEFTAAALYVLAIFTPFNQLLYQAGTAQMGLTCLRRVMGLTQLPSVPAEDATTGRTETWSVDLARVGYSYPGRPRAIAGIDLRADDGSLTVIVGRSGSGKSTLAKLLGGLLTPDEGEIRVGGEPRSPQWLASEVAMVTQDTMALTGTLRWNLQMGTESVDDERLAAAMAEFGADEWLRELEDGLDTPVGRNGVPLSVAQLQQVALARLSLSSAKILVLDEPTSATGGSGTARLDQAIRRLAAHRTVFVVVHRLSLAPVANRILVMERGRVIEYGTHRELLHSPGSYRELWNSWATGEGIG